ncbi:hypothetical protein BH10ACT11_BH10ACT11_15950 [soil metagenome]
MTTELKLSDIDVDGAIRESAEEATATLTEEGDTRADFLKKAGLAGGAAMSGGALLGALAPGSALGALGKPKGNGKGRPPKSFGKGDIGILNYALTLEYLEAAFYAEAKKNNRSGAIATGYAGIFLNAVNRDEAAHVKYLKKALGNKAVKSPKFDFGSSTQSASAFIATSYALENTGVGAYSGQALNIKSNKVVKAALSIVTIEARHASVAGILFKNDRHGIAPDGPFDDAKTAAQTLRKVKATGFIK